MAFETGERLMHEGEPGDKVALILSGRVKVSHVGTDGREQVLDFRALLDRPEFAAELLRRLSQRFRDADRKRIEFGATDTVGRVAARLVELAERYGEPDGGGVAIALPINQEELAGWTAASRASMANALQTLRELGWIETGRRRIKVLDIEALRRRSVQN